MKRKRENEIGMARALWLQEERKRLRVEAMRPHDIGSFNRPLLSPPLPLNMLCLLGGRYTDFTVIQQMQIGVDASWLVHHARSGQHRRVVLTHAEACRLPYGDLQSWAATRVLEAADDILSKLPQRTM